MEIDDLIVDGDTVAIRNTWYGTQEAEFYGVPPSGEKVAVTRRDRPRHRRPSPRAGASSTWSG
jgi:hypothetical protein